MRSTIDSLTWLGTGAYAAVALAAAVAGLAWYAGSGHTGLGPIFVLVVLTVGIVGALRNPPRY